MPRFNCELLLVIDADNVEDADELASFIAREAGEVYGPKYAHPDDALKGVVATSTVESIALKKRIDGEHLGETVD